MVKRTSLVLVLLTLIAACKEERITKDRVTQTLDSLEHKFVWLDYRISQELWEQYTTGSSDSLRFYEGLFNYVVSDDDLPRILQQGRSLISDDLENRRFELIEAAVLRGQVEASEPVAQLRDSLSELDMSFRASLDGQERPQAELYRVYRTADDRTRRETAWRAYHQIGEQFAPGLERLFRLRNQQVQRMGYNNFYALMFAEEGFDLPSFLSLVNYLDSLSLAPYRQILDNVASTTGSPQVEIWDLGYAYSGTRSRIDRYFPADNQLEYIANSLMDVDYDIDKLPLYFDLSPRDEKSQWAFSFPIKPPHDVRVLANVTDGIRSALTLMHEIGHALYATHITEDRPLFIQSVAPAWTEGMARITAGFMQREEWLTAYAGVPPSVAQAYLEERRERDIIDLRSRLLQLMFEYEAYRNPNRDLNRLYWDLFEQYMLLPRHEDTYPWASIIHYTTHPVYIHNYLYADIIAAQTFHALEEMYGDIVGNEAFSSFLNQNYFRFGARYEWRDLLERGTGERLDPEHLIRSLGIEEQQSASL